MTWLYGDRPSLPGTLVDFGAESVQFGANAVRSAAVAGVQTTSPGDWTIYLSRQTLIANTTIVPAGPTPIIALRVSTKVGNVASDLMDFDMSITPQGLAFNRGVALHVSADSIDVSIRYRLSGRPSDDRLVSWLSPGRPSSYRLPWLIQYPAGAVNTAWNRIPQFAQSIEVALPTTAKAATPIIEWWLGTAVLEDSLVMIPSATINTTIRSPIPGRATHWRFVDAAAAAPYNLTGDFECIS